MKEYVRLKELNLNKEENSKIQYIMKSDFIRKIIKKEINFDDRKFTEFIQVSSEILESENLKEQLKEVKETLKMQLVKELISENHLAIQDKNLQIHRVFS